MYKQKLWSKDVVSLFADLALLSEEEVHILLLRAKNYSIKEISDELNISSSTVSRRIKLLRIKYTKLKERGYDLPDRIALDLREN